MEMPKMPDPPKQPDPVRIPSPDDPELRAARKDKMLGEMKDRRGRKSTILSDGASPTYSRSTLG